MIDGDHILIEAIPHQRDLRCFPKSFKSGGFKEPDGIVTGIAVQSLRETGFTVAGRHLELMHECPEHIRNASRIRDGRYLRLRAGELGLDLTEIPHFRPGDGVDTDERITVLGRAIVGTFQQDGIAEPVAQTEINTHRRVDVRQHAGDFGSNVDLLHMSGWMEKEKAPL